MLVGPYRSMVIVKQRPVTDRKNDSGTCSLYTTTDKNVLGLVYAYDLVMKYELKPRLRKQVPVMSHLKCSCLAYHVKR